MNIAVSKVGDREFVTITGLETLEEANKDLSTEPDEKLGYEGETVIAFQKITEPEGIVSILEAIICAYDDPVQELEEVFTQIYNMGLQRGRQQTPE